MNLADLAALGPENQAVEMKLTRVFRRRATKLLDQQCGLWGHDVRREVNGARQNVLLQLGFTRTPPPEGVLGATTYARRETGGQYVTLWGFGMRFGDAKGAIFLARAAFWPSYCAFGAPDHIWMPSQLEDFRVPQCAGDCLAALRYLHGMLAWIGDYERAIEAQFGPEYRAEVLQNWRKSKTSTEAVNIARDWDELAGDCGLCCRFTARSTGRVEFSEREAAL